MSDQIQNKLLQIEVQPPEEVWNRLAVALDDQALGDIGRKLSDFEVSPAPDAWNKINSLLEGNTPAVIIPFHQKYRRHIKYGSAVAIFAVAALISNLLISKKNAAETTVHDIVKKEFRVPAMRLEEDGAPLISPSVNERQAGEAIVVENSFGPGDHKTANYVKRKSGRVAPMAMGLTSAGMNSLPQVAKRNTVIAFNEDSENYMAYSMDDGNAVKLPKKMFDALTCPTKDANCLQKIKQLQQKIAASALVADFAGVLDILNNLGENQ